MLVRLYAKFPAFKLISEEQFVALFGSLKYVIDRDCVLLGYKDGALASRTTGGWSTATSRSATCPPS